ncbi:DEAD/DEAH box helicase [Clostridium baratii]|uniref:DEAD/DEAH box helicase n=1 Tax=Clostridium baratii TaxID=1561 RepID=UPI00097FBB27|nr:DEAD/DEAH box helicase [Clostridium baratii]AQM59935.1 hypothetical protein NPD11_2689 [Clostridium baratii]
MRENQRTVGEWIFNNIEENEYLKKLYNELIIQYTNKLQGYQYILEEKHIMHLFRFADILSKSNNELKKSFHKNIAQNIVCILEKIYPENEYNKLYMGSVLSNINNYVGLSGKCSSYWNADFVEGFVETIIKEKYRIPEECGKNMFFDASQSLAFNNITNQNYYSFSGPTSMGKTFLIKIFIKSLILKKLRNNYVIVVPSKALINEVKSEIINEIGMSLEKEKYKVITTPSEILNDEDFRYIMIYTQERLSYQIKIHEGMIIDYIFIDEAQKISDISMRSVYFYKIIDYLVKKNNKTKVYFLCPYIPNPQIYLDLVPNINENEKKYDVFEFSPVNQHKSIVDISKNKINIYSDLTREFIEYPIQARYSYIVQYIYEIGKHHSNIIFCDSKKAVEDYAIQYWKLCNLSCNPKLKELIEDIKREIHPQSYLVSFLKKGICCHVGYLPSTIKAKIERLFREKIIKTIFCTSTLLEGVNLPADNLFIIIKNNSYILKKSADFKNLIGRVGRKTYNLIGNVYITPEIGDDKKTYDRCKELIEKPIENQKLSIDKILDTRLKRKIVKSLLCGNGTIDKGNMPYEKFGMARFITNILIKSISENNRNNYIFKQFSNELNNNDIELIKKNFKMQEISDDSNITVDQIRKIDKEILENKIKYPENIDYDEVKTFLEELYDLFNWGKYESKKSIGKKEKLTYYAVLLNQWMKGYSIKRIIDKSIEHHCKTGEIYDVENNQLVKYTGQRSQNNSIVIESLTAIEDVILFSISNYFTKFSERYKYLKRIDIIENDWSEYVDFGTNDNMIIKLQKIGFSREVAQIIKKNRLADIDDEGILKFSREIFNNNNELLIVELEDVKLNYAELFKSFKFI